METIYTVDYYLNKFKSIPASQFCTYDFKNLSGARCFLGHTMPDSVIDKLKSNPTFIDEEGRSMTTYNLTQEDIDQLTECVGLCKLFGTPKEGQRIVFDINNGDDPRYQQPTVKGRILAALEDIKKLQQPEPKERIVYVMVDSTVKELSGQLTNN